jgi:hypothetical protein
MVISLLFQVAEGLSLQFGVMCELMYPGWMSIEAIEFCHCLMVGSGIGDIGGIKASDAGGDGNATGPGATGAEKAQCL